MLETGIGLLHRLTVYEHAAHFLVAASQLLEVHQADEQGLIPMKDTSILISEASAALISLAEVLAEPWGRKEAGQAAIPDLRAGTGGLSFPPVHGCVPGNLTSSTHRALL